MPLALPTINDERLLARYPFMPQGREHMRQILEINGVTIEDLIEAPWLEDVRTRGRLRLLIVSYTKMVQKLRHGLICQRSWSDDKSIVLPACNAGSLFVLQ